MFVTATTAGTITISIHPSTPLHEFKPPQFVNDIDQDMLVKFGGDNLILFTGPFKQPRIVFYDFMQKQVVKSFVLQVY
jgi:hypothetical protein